MKKCPGCGSLTSDNSLRCGLCGRSLAGVASFQGTVQDAAREAQIEKRASDERLRKMDFGRRLKSWLIGVLGGIAIIAVGFLLAIMSVGYYVSYLGYLLIAFGFLVTVRSFFSLRRGPVDRGVLS